ncbi:sex comb on midleg-like protein 1 [Nannospalax galili]|uniref:sex comb on midleg-like protein 1 n=1 Tax=Nannospalax galili TaxID=1026970 RepID=UPI0004ED4F56|nr:sex comb on midleg-like protein 1 [Nannospalax galili]
MIAAAAAAAAAVATEAVALALVAAVVAINESVQKLEEKVKSIDEKVSKLQTHRTREFWTATVQPYKPEKTTENTEVTQNPENQEDQNILETPENPEPIASISYHSEASQDAYPESPQSGSDSAQVYNAYEDQAYDEYLESDDAGAGTSAEPYYSQDLDMAADDASIYREDPGELGPTQNIETRRQASPEPQYSSSDPVAENEDIVFQCNLAVMEQLYIGDPTTWTVGDVLQFLYSVDAPMADYLFNFISRHDIDGNALLRLTTERLVRIMGLNLGVARKLCVYIDHLKDIIRLYQ